ncbi:MAG: beta-lactamase family protein [candidate division Zixibacteria bacterium]|nr:beta-lactamase family protein [candidate division Zixibacteria bacterium]
MKSSMFVRRFFIASAVFSVFTFCATVHSQKNGDLAEQVSIAQTIEDLKTDLDSIFDEISTPGAAVAIVSADSIIWIGTFGFANIETQEPVTENTHFCIGSCTKSFLGLGFLKLLDEGEIDLNTPVKEIAPEIEIDNPWADTHPVRVIHLLEHTAGFDDSHPNWFYFKGPVLPLRRALEEKARLRKVRWQPGTRYSYSSAGFVLAGYILEKVSGQRYEDYLKENLLDPIGMRTSTIGSSEECRRLLAVGYDRYARPFPVWYDYDEPAGAMNSSIKEMALFVQFMLNRGVAGNARIISDVQFSRVGRPSSTLAAEAGLESGYSFGIGTSYRGGAKWLSHGGAVPGFLAAYAASPENRIGYVVLQNSFDISFHDDMFTCVPNYANSLAHSVAPSPSPPVPADVLETYCGYYEPRSPRLQLMAFADLLTGGLTVSFERDTLYTQGFMEDRTPLIPVSDNLFRLPWHPEASSIFTRSSEGRMVYASMGSYYEKTSVWVVYLHRVLVLAAVLIMLSSIIYSLFGVPAHIYKKLKHKNKRSKYIRMRVIPLLAVLSLILGVVNIGDQTILELGMVTPLNIIFFVSTLVFAGLSTLSLLTTFRSFFKPVRMSARVYAVLLSLSCFGFTVYLSYWGVIGLRLWAY